MVEIINSDWLDHLRSDSKQVSKAYFISPFIGMGMVNHLYRNNKNIKLRLITRFNLNDFRSNVSNISALKQLILFGAEIKGIKDLHSKSYIFGHKSVIISSANFTIKGFNNNYEFGVKLTSKDHVNKAKTYFEELWDIGSNILTIHQIEEWEKIISSSPIINENRDLPDYGETSSSLALKNKRIFLKIFGKADNRVSENFLSKQEIINSHCHFALTFSGKKGKPRKYRNGDIVFMARMMEGGEYAIFGRANTLQHQDNRDEASLEDISQIPWKAEWPVYIRVYNAEFIDAKLEACPKLSDLINHLDYESFTGTSYKNFIGEQNINPWNSLRQQADVELTHLAANWLENKFNEALKINGLVPKEFIDSLYQGSWKDS